MASTYLTRTNGTATNNKICTFSAWLKLASDSSYMRIFTAQSDVSGRDSLYLNSGELNFYQRNGTTSTVGISGNRLFRDVSAWYHLVVACDSTQATASDRIKIYLNGEQQTLDGTQIPQNQTFAWNEDNLIAIGADSDGSPSEYFDGSMSHIHFIDGTAYDATAFGQYDANGVWTIKTSPSVTYGSQGYFILKDGNSLTDQSGEGNNFTVGGGTLTNTEDSPSNVFATLNAIRPLPTGFSLSNGNTKFSTASGSDTGNVNSTILANQGKFYAECKLAGGAEKEGIGAIGENELPTNHFGNGTQNILFNADIPAVFINGTQTNVSGVTPANGDILGMALDLDNGRAYFHVNGTYINSGNPSTETGYYSFTVGSVFWGIGSADGSSLTGSAEMNYGNGYFGTTAVSSAGTNASGNGIFEYDCPDGYTALSTKGLNL